MVGAGRTRTDAGDVAAGQGNYPGADDRCATTCHTRGRDVTHPG
jgi:hypothetical protein